MCLNTELSMVVGLGCSIFLWAGVSHLLAALHPSSGLIGIVCHCGGAGRPWGKVSSIFAKNSTNYLYLYAVLSRGVQQVVAIKEHSAILLTVYVLDILGLGLLGIF